MKNSRRLWQLPEISSGAALAVAILIIATAFAAAPAAHAQIVPVSLAHEALPDSKIPARPALLPLPHFEPRKPVKDEYKRLFWMMSAGVYAAAGLDMQETASFRPHFHEVDPLARPLVGLPAPAYYASGALFATGINWLGWKMARSPRWHKIWWIPQVTSMAGNLAGYSYTRAH
ncbi:MAG: hypothetical protein WB621_02580 [Candidatus Acidiferrales bacterium]